MDVLQAFVPKVAFASFCNRDMMEQISCSVGGANEGDVWLAWCFEHCLKREHSPVHEELELLATRFGRKLICHKKLSSTVGNLLTFLG